ncbi:MAG: hypothetical protein DRG31_06910, partial [Deltaproteobacteria bacterium]
MIIRKLIMTVKAPYYYYTHGGLFANPEPFLGDIALMYALGYSLLELEYPLADKRVEHIKSFPFFVTVGIPRVFKTKRVMIVASSFENALLTMAKIFAKKGGITLYKNIRRIKAIDIGTVFEAYY